MRGAAACVPNAYSSRELLFLARESLRSSRRWSVAVPAAELPSIHKRHRPRMRVPQRGPLRALDISIAWCGDALCQRGGLDDGVPFRPQSARLELARDHALVDLALRATAPCRDALGDRLRVRPRGQ